MMWLEATASQAGHLLSLLLGFHAVMLSLRLHWHDVHLQVHAHLQRPEMDELPAQYACSVRLSSPYCDSLLQKASSQTS